MDPKREEFYSVLFIKGLFTWCYFDFVILPHSRAWWCAKHAFRIQQRCPSAFEIVFATLQRGLPFTQVAREKKKKRQRPSQEAWFGRPIRLLTPRITIPADKLWWIQARAPAWELSGYRTKTGKAKTWGRSLFTKDTQLIQKGHRPITIQDQNEYGQFDERSRSRRGTRRKSKPIRRLRRTGVWIMICMVNYKETSHLHNYIYIINRSTMQTALLSSRS